MGFNKEELFKKRLQEEEIEIPGVGTVRVRALSRSEAMKFEGIKLEVEVIERKMLAVALVDPVLTEDEIGQWQQASSAGEITTVLLAVLRLSGMETESLKQAVKQFRD